MVGIDISDRSIKVVEVTGHDNPTLRTMCWSPLSANLMRRGVVQDVALVTEALKTALAGCTPIPIEGGDVVASIPEVQSFVRVLDIPMMSYEEMDEAVQWAVRRHIPFDLDRVYIDWELLQGQANSKRKQVLVGAAQRDVVDPLLAVLDSLELNVVALELEAQAVMRCLLPSDQAEVLGIHGVLVIDLGATSTNIVLFDGGSMRFTTNIQWGGDDITQQFAQKLNLSPKRAIEKKAELGMKDKPKDSEIVRVLHESTLELVRKIERAVQEMTVQLSPDQKVKVVLLSGGSSNLFGIIDLFSNAFPGVPVQLGNPWTNIMQDKKKGGLNLSTSDAMHFTTAIGLALRQSEF